MRTNPFLERARHKINLLNQARSILVIDQRRASARSEMYLRSWDPLCNNCSKLRRGNTVTAVIVNKVIEFRFEREPHELLSAVIFINPSVARLGIEWQCDRLTDCGLRGEMFRPHNGAVLMAMTKNHRGARTHYVGAIALNVPPSHVLVQEFHNRIGESMRIQVAEIVLGDRPVAIRFLRRAANSLAAGKNETRELTLNVNKEFAKRRARAAVQG